MDDITEIQNTINDVLSRWAPFPEETFQQKVMRALLQLAAFEKDYKRVMNGEQPIRTFYPLELPKKTDS